MDITSMPLSLDINVEDATKLQNLNTLGAILLGIFTIVSFVGNIFLVSTVASSYQLRRFTFNYFLINISLVNLIDTSVNLVLSMLYVSTGQWQLGKAACMLNSFFQQLVLIESMISVVLLTVDRAVSLQSIGRYEERMTALRSALIVAGTWSMGGVVSLPLLINTWSEPNRYRYFCCNYANNPLGYPLSILIVCFCIPLFIALLSLGAIFWRSHEERLRRRAMLPERLADYTDFIVDNRRTQKQMELAKYSVVTFLVYFLLQGPYVVFNFYAQIRNSSDLVQAYGTKGPMITGDAETAITWLKTLFPVSFPFLTFCLCKDIWRKFKDLICCRRSNTITSNAFASNLETAEVAAMATSSGGQCVGSAGGHGYGNMNGKEMANVVTIVPTSAGIHQIRPGNDRCEYADVPQTSASNRRDSQRRHRPGSTTSGRTSDYDSEDSEMSSPIDQPEIINRETALKKCPNQRPVRKSDQSDQQSLKSQPPVQETRPNASTLTASGHSVLSPSAIDADQEKIDDEKKQDWVSFGKNNPSDEWPTVFRPKSSSGLKHEQVNPGFVPSPEKAATRRQLPQNPHASPEKRRSSFDEKMKSILQRNPIEMDENVQSVIRHNHLPPLHDKKNELSPKRGQRKSIDQQIEDASESVLPKIDIASSALDQDQSKSMITKTDIDLISAGKDSKALPIPNLPNSD